MSSIKRSKMKFIWRFPSSKIDHLPSCTSISNIQLIDKDTELLYRQQLAILIYNLGQHINVSFTCIYTGVVYMHRFFMLHPFQQFHKELVAAACLFLSCKVNEMARPLNELTRYLYQILHRNHNNENSSSFTSEIYLTSNQQIIDYENILLSTLGFCLNVEQPYVILTRISQTLSIPIEITEKANDIATKSIFLTLFSLKYTTNLIACFALYLTIKTCQINMPENEDGSQWFHLLNEEFTEKLLEDLVEEYQFIYLNKCPKEIQQRFEKIVCQQIKSTMNDEQSNLTVLSTDLSQQQYPNNSICQQAIVRNAHTPIRSSLVPIPHVDYSPKVSIQLARSPSKSNSNHFNGQYHENSNSIVKSLAKPIPTLMTTTTTNPHSSHSNSYAFPYYSRFSAPIFKQPILSPNEHIYRSITPSSSSSLPIHVPQYPCPYPSNYVLPSSYYPQQQAPLFYPSHSDLTSLNNKRYGEPPAPPTKRFRYNLNAYQHY